MSQIYLKSIFLILVVNLAAHSLVTGQLHQSNQDSLKKFANQEVSKIVHGEFKNPFQEIESLVQSSHALEILSDLPKADQVCKTVKKGLKELLGQDEQNVKALYHVAEISRLFKCDFQKQVQTNIESLDASKITNPADLYYAYLLHINAKEYGLKGGKDKFTDSIKEPLTKNFNSSDWSIVGSKEKGISIDGLRLACVIADIQKGGKEIADLKTGLTKLQKQAVQDTDTFSFLSSSSNNLDTSDLNLFVMKINEKAGGFDLTDQQKVGLRNFFLSRTKLSLSIHTLVSSLRGLKHLKQIPYLHLTGKQSVSLNDPNNQNIKFEVLDTFGNPFEKVNTVSVSLTQLDGSKTTKDVTADTKLTKGNTVGTLNLKGREVGKYRLTVNIDGYSHQSLITVTDALKISSLEYTVSTSSISPDKADGKVEFPTKIPSIKQATNDHYIHLRVDASFAKSTTIKPAQVYLSLKKKGEDRSLFVNSYGKIVDKLYEITFDVSKGMEHLNGDYEMTVHVADYRADSKIIWDLGTIKIWYKEGLDDANNSGIKPEYKPDTIIQWTLPHEGEQISPIIPLAISGLLVVLFLKYLLSLFSNRANLSKLDFFGVLFIIVFLGVMAILSAFFIEVKLIPIMWILLFISIPVLFIGYQALARADCTIGEYKEKQVGSKKRVE